MTTDLIFHVGFTMILALDVVGNAIVIFLILKYRAMKTPMNYLLLNLAVADIMVGLFFAPTFLFDELLTETTATVLCKTSSGRNFGWIASLVSAFSLVWVAVERFYAVVHPTSTRHKITNRKLKRIVPACWILATVHTIPSFIIKVVDSDMKLCRATFPEHWQKVAYWLLWLVNAAIVPVCTMVILYSRVVHSLWIKSTVNATHLAVINARKRVTKKSITVSIIYALAVLPFHVFHFASIFYPELFPSKSVRFKAAICLLVLNSTANPFVYTFQCEKFRKHLKRLVC